VADFFGIQSPFLDTCGIRPVAREEGRVVAEVAAAGGNANSFGLAHGGLTMTLLDSCLGAAARFADPAAENVMTVSLSVSFVGPARGRITGEGRVVRRAGELVFCEGEARAEDGSLAARALGVFKLRLRGG
jgi:uncharacterized protein (TIGR00369 family)